jgi:hypothetical protein
MGRSRAFSWRRSGVRVIAVLAYPAPLWFGDSPGYLEAAIRLRPGETRPSGYPFLLWLIEPFHSFTVVVAVQHAIGLLSGVLVYAVVLRATRAAWPPDEPGRGLCRGGGHDPGDSRLGDR